MRPTVQPDQAKQHPRAETEHGGPASMVASRWQVPDPFRRCDTESLIKGDRRPRRDPSLAFDCLVLLSGQSHGGPPAWQQTRF